MVFPKKSRWNMIFLVLLGKTIFLFPENMILHLRRKMNANLSQKQYTEIWYFLQTFWKDGLLKQGQAGTWPFLYHLERWYFFYRKHFFFLEQEVRDNLSQEVHGNMIFSVYTTGVTNVTPCPSIQKKIKDGLIPQVYT